MMINRRSFLYGAGSVLALSRLAFAKQSEFDCDICIAGGGTGGVAAALAALHRGMRVVMSEPTDWVGGQLTAQAVPPDEHPYIEKFGCTRRYRQYRNDVRDYYRQHYPLTAEAKARPELNPGNGGSSQVSAEFRVCMAVLEAMLLPYIGNGQLTLLLRHTPESASMDGDSIRALTLKDAVTGRTHTVTARYFIDATELGDLLPMTKTEFVTGTESHAETGELHAPAVGNPAGSQGFTYCFAMDYLHDEDHTIDKPADYAFWQNFVPKLTPPYPGKQINWTIPVPTAANKSWTQYMQPNPDAKHDTWGNLWFYRRIADPRNFKPGAYRSGITVVNWFQNDYSDRDLLTASPEERVKLHHNARQLSLSLMYWMQTEAPRIDGGAGFKGLRLRRDVTDTEDGLAKHAYIREARRIKAEFTVTEKHVGTTMRMQETGRSKDDVRAAVFADSVGVGAYKMDLHPTAGGANTVDASAVPYQIPLGALLPIRTENLLPAAKNIGTTHMTNACYRVHVSEWNIGEAAGAVAAQAVRTGKTPRQIRANKGLLSDLQSDLRQDGFELEWPAEAKAIDW
ncbi:MAG TPA: FAD-dependent oxidoreductase [Acidobacteriaceae bacterium]